ncbi:MAG: hypothetical protein B6I20_04740 [Bacteroidetes bacterium 4572_117]|nr:MAG: hypothetical protein B6I20_04740 [Bacteroidetes bacterium 4572_117]
MRKHILVILFIFSTTLVIQAQSRISVLEKTLKTQTGKNRFETLYQLSKAYLTVSPKKSLDYANKAYTESIKLGNENMQANALNLIGTAYYKQKKYKSAIKNYEKELDIRKKLGQKISHTKTLYNIALVYEANKKERKALSIYKNALTGAKEAKYHKLVLKCYESVIKIYEREKNYKNAYIYISEYNAYKGAANITFERQQINILETKYEEGQKELEEKNLELNMIDSTLLIVQNEKETLVKDTAIKGLEISGLTVETEEQKHTIKEKDAEVKKQQQWLIAFSVFFTLILIFSILLYKLYTSKKKAYKLLTVQNAEIIEKNEEIQVQSEQLLTRNAEVIEKNEEIEAQSEELEKQRDVALKRKEEIVDSINYAKRIQKAVFPAEKYVKKVLHEYFVLLKPRDIVSGDFYWIKKVDEFIVIAVADCTGHGVPGAFMSMLGISLLNETVKVKSINNTGKILDNLRSKVKKSLGQNGAEDEAKDGMDIALYIINTKTLELQYSGAYNPLYIIRESLDEKIETIKADRQPIGVHLIEKDFTNHKYQLQKNDRLYSFSDGYADQFGGKNGRKFRIENFKEVLLANYKKPMKEQKKILNSTLNNWMGSTYEQIDDILVLGIKV